MNTCIVCNLRTTIRMDQLFRIFWRIKVHLLISSDIKCSIISISYYIYHVCMQLLFEDNDPFYATFFSLTCDEYDKMLQMCDTFFKLDRCKLHGPTCCCCYSNFVSTFICISMLVMMMKNNSWGLKNAKRFCSKGIFKLCNELYRK